MELHIESDSPLTVRYSNGEATTTAQPAAGGTMRDIEFDAPRPWVVAATMVAEQPGRIACSIRVDGKMAARTNEGNGTFAMCVTTEMKGDVDDYDHDGETFRLRTTSLTGGWTGWATSYNGNGETTEAGTYTGTAYQTTTEARLVAVADQPGDTSTCQITIDDAGVATDKTDGLGAIATCSTK